MSNTRSDSADDRAEQSSSTDESGVPNKKKANLAVRLGKGAGKALWYGSAADVLARDAKRLRPLHPGLWKDVFGPKGRNAVRSLLGRREKGADYTIKTTSFTQGVLSAMISLVIGVAVSFYGFQFGTTLASEDGIPVGNKIIALCLTATGIVFAFVNLIIMAVLVRKKLAERKNRPTRAR